MANTAALYPGAAPVDDPTTTVGAVAWTNPGRAQSQNDSGATVSIDRTNASHYLIANTFGPSLPAGCTLNGLVVEVRAKRTSGTGTGSLLSVQWCGLTFSKGSWSLSTYGSAKTNSSGLTGSFAYYTFGTSSDVWGTSNPASDFNADSTGVAIQVSTGNPTDTPAYEVDTVRVTYYYTEAATGKRSSISLSAGIRL